MSKKRYVVKHPHYGYWEDTGYCKQTGELENCDKFRFWLVAFLAYFDQIVDGDGKIEKIEI